MQEAQQVCPTCSTVYYTINCPICYWGGENKN